MSEATARDGREVILRLDDVHTYYGSIQALKGISLEVRDGEIVTLIGANGAGKSTTLRSINGLNTPRQGTIVFQGKDITRRSPHDIVEMSECAVVKLRIANRQRAREKDPAFAATRRAGETRIGRITAGGVGCRHKHR